MKSKPTGYYRKEDKHGKMVTHPVFGLRARKLKRASQPKYYKVAADLDGTIREFTAESEQKGTIPVKELVKMKKDGHEVIVVSNTTKTSKFKEIAKKLGIKGYPADKRFEHGKDLKGAQVYIGNLPIDKKRAENQNAQFVKIPGRTVQLKLISVPIADLKPSKTELDETKVQKFIDLYKRGQTIPPPLVHKLPDGSVEIMDGHHRIEAQRRMGVKEISVVENSIMDTLKMIGRGIKGVAKGFRYKVAPAKEEGYTLAERRGAQVGAGIRQAAHGVGTGISALGRIAGAPSEVKEKYYAGREAHLPPEVRRKRALQRAQWNRYEIVRLIDKTESPDRATRISALAKLRMQYPYVYEVINRELKRSVKCRGVVKKKRDKSEFAPFENKLKEQGRFGRKFGGNPFASSGKSF